MNLEVRACASQEEAGDALRAISHYFGVENALEDVERFVRWTAVDRLHAALRVEEHAAGAVECADRMFGSWPKPWCPEIF